MAETLDKATLLRNAAVANRNKQGKRVKSEELLVKVVEFVNDGDSFITNLQDNYPSYIGKSGALVQRLRKLILENKLQDNVWAMSTDDDGAILVNVATIEA